MISILVKDNQNKEFEVLMHLGDETELLICGNINHINRKMNRKLQVETYADGIEEYWIKRGYTRNQGLYDKLIMEYNQAYEDLLTRWK